ncbi:MAG: hypothetical protein KJO49_10450 [Bacteroidia bacterium]|nr:hypothetical protein [Bacteroidia bacterium]MBT8267896.1 hypothetical protein [Bacteroidia bacterium]NNF81543.1 hypothetical protein [Flavobacteriaceae bacterium]NNK71543.1 hypothetical protein [Flavobacteriaceae bacterium]NNL80837.1 hypothetical protein [Flavobacteriaceae bacterium]
MRTLLLIIGFLAAILGLIMTVLPFGYLGFLPVVLALIIGFIVFKMDKSQNASGKASKIIIAIGVIGLALGLYRTIFDTNVVADDQEVIKQEEESLEEAKKELEDLDIDE